MSHDTQLESPIDLHMHTTASDGMCSPQELVEMAVNKGYTAIAITDHDTVSGITVAVTEGMKRKIEIVPGIELSANFCPVMHILGFYLNINNISLKKRLKLLDNKRMRLISKSFKLLKEKGVPITPAQLLQRQKVITIVSLKNYLLEHNSLDDELNKHFDDMLIEWRQYLPSPKECIELIHNCKGLAFLAHPMLLNMDDYQLKKLLLQLKNEGLDGIEIIHPKHSEKERIQLQKWAKEIGLLYSGGSDYHSKDSQLHCVNNIEFPYVPYSCLRIIQRRLEGNDYA